jgi:GNAT superfamily N-acetyltransferase
MATLLRQAQRDDVSGIQRVRHTVRENILTSSVISDADVIEHLEVLGRGWVIEVDGQIRGFAIGNARSANIWALFVEHGHERCGHGRRLHDTMLAWLWSQGLQRLWLTTGPDTRAGRFYRAAGWHDTGRTTHGEVRFEIGRPPG